MYCDSRMRTRGLSGSGEPRSMYRRLKRSPFFVGSVIVRAEPAVSRFGVPLLHFHEPRLTVGIHQQADRVAAVFPVAVALSGRDDFTVRRPEPPPPAVTGPI